MEADIKKGKNIYNFIAGLYPICRSVTGNGVRKTLSIIGKEIPLEVFEIPSGTKVFDWTVPFEWNIQDAYLKDPKGKKIIDFKNSNLHVLNYSVPVNKTLSLKELKEHLYTLPSMPNAIPYMTSYYNNNWGFCLTYNQFRKLDKGNYQAVISSSLDKGSLTYAECLIPGKSKEEILFSTYVCHPSLCNDNLSGVAMATFLAKELIAQQKTLRYSYRFLFIPETIGSLTWLFKNQKQLGRIKAGLVITCVGDKGSMTYKKSRSGDSLIDHTVIQVLKDSGQSHKIVDFFPTGSDERQFCSPGFNLPIGSLMRTPYGQYREYHTSADNMVFIKPEALNSSLQAYLSVVNVLEKNRKYKNLNPKGEPMLGKRGLYRQVNKPSGRDSEEMARLWVLNLSDGKHSLLDICQRSGLSFSDINHATEELLKVKLLK